jgi:CcmD family protein
MRIASLLYLLGLTLFSTAEDAAGLFYSSGKIYVVVGVLLIIFVGIIVYLVRLDKKVKDLEKRNEA